METYLNLTKEHWWRMYGVTDIADPSYTLKLRPLSDIKSMEVVQVCAYAAPLSFMSYEDREPTKWNAIENKPFWTVDCDSMKHYFLLSCSNDSGFSLYAYNKVAVGTVICNPMIITELATAIAYLISIKIDVFNLNRFGFVKLYTTIDPVVQEITKSSPWTRKKK